MKAYVVMVTDFLLPTARVLPTNKGCINTDSGEI